MATAASAIVLTNGGEPPVAPGIHRPTAALPIAAGLVLAPAWPTDGFARQIPAGIVSA